MRFLPAISIGVLVLTACGGAKATEPPPAPTVSPLGHAWVVRVDSTFIRGSNGPAAGGSPTYDWCPLHGGHKPRSDAEAIDAMQWVAAHP